MQPFLIKPLAVALILMTSFASASPLVLGREVLDARVAKGLPLSNRAPESIPNLHQVRAEVEIGQMKRSPVEEDPESDFENKFDPFL
ncbi:hypothetical protein SCHPADRAFT_936656 [Schizopora paradoxa]|uniref:Uncharacterized protein n=1 Tax=Schizopora paradoxa TaxID=27342 RepID=A0A0H2SL32_9AGAM|nr:hypothetical protein SCHPADRAFT_936656 [Schizopora paradoxa]